jgi:1,4-alpha-glucan branching enzyme
VLCCAVLCCAAECLKWDDTLWSHADHFKYRWGILKNIRNAIDQNEGGLEKFSKGALTNH